MFNAPTFPLHATYDNESCIHLSARVAGVSPSAKNHLRSRSRALARQCYYNTLPKANTKGERSHMILKIQSPCPSGVWSSTKRELAFISTRWNMVGLSARESPNAANWRAVSSIQPNVPPKRQRRINSPASPNKSGSAPTMLSRQAANRQGCRCSSHARIS